MTNVDIAYCKIYTHQIPYNYGLSPEGGVSFYSAIMYSCTGYFLGYCQVIKSLKSESDAQSRLFHR